ARARWDGALSGTELVGFGWVSLLGFIRLTTNRVALRPLPVEEVLERIESWLGQPNLKVIQPTHRHAEVPAGLLRRLGTAGNLTTNAHLAALAIEHDCTLYS